MSETMQILKLADTGRVTTRLGYGCSSLHGALERDAELCRRWSALVGMDLTHLESLASLMLKAAFVFNTHSVILVSSKNPMQIEANVRVVSDESLTGPVRRLHGLLQLEGVPSGRSIEVTA
jgi:hypothetical protein